MQLSNYAGVLRSRDRGRIVAEEDYRYGWHCDMDGCKTVGGLKDARYFCSLCGIDYCTACGHKVQTTAEANGRYTYLLQKKD